VVLRQQVARLTPLEQMLLIWLAVVREWTSLESLLSLLVKRPTRARMLEALEALSRRSLIERGQGASFTLQSVVMEYVTDALLDHLSEEIRTMALGHPGLACAVVWGPSGKRLVSGGDDGTLRWWEVQRGAHLRTDLHRCPHL